VNPISDVKVFSTATGRELWDDPVDGRITGPLTFGPDGRRLLWTDGLILRSADPATGYKPGGGEIPVEFSKLLNKSLCACFSPDGRRLAISSDLVVVRILDLNGKELRTLRRDAVGSLGGCLAFSPDGRRLAARRADGLLVWDTATGKLEQSFPDWRDEGGTDGLAFSPDGRQLAASSAGHLVKLWDLKTGQMVRMFQGHQAAVTDVSFSPDGHRLATAGSDATVRLWDIATAKPLAILRGHQDEVSRVIFSPDGKELASFGLDGARLWDATRLTDERVLGHPAGSCLRVAFGPDGQRLALSSPQWPQVYDLTAGRPVFPEPAGLAHQVRADLGFALSPDGRLVAAVAGSVAEQQGVKFWNPADPAGLAFARYVAFWDARTGQEVGEPLAVPTGPLTAVAFSPDGKHLATGGSDATVRVWDVATRRAVHALGGEEATSLAYSPDGRRLASAGGGRARIKVWVPDTGRELRTFWPKMGSVTCLAFSPDGTRLAAGSTDATTRVLDASSGRELLVLRGHAGKVRSVAFSPDGRRLVSGSDDRTVKVWDATTGQELLSLSGHPGGVTCVAFSPDGHRIASAGDDVRIWDGTPPGQE
jgi:WD40 repeat protein